MNLQKLLDRPFPTVSQSYDAKTTLLYALGVGAGADPVSERELPFVFEAHLRAIPSQVSVLGYPGFWLAEPELGVDWLKMLHGEQHLIFGTPLAAAGDVRANFKIVGVDDKGQDKGATIFFEKEISDANTGALISTVRSTYFLRGDGGCGSWGEIVAPPSALPDRKPDLVFDCPTLPRQALIYRLSGDMNPIHADPKAAASAGFDRPILHGLCTFGVATYGLVQQVCDGIPERLREIFVRFSRPTYPGETIRLECFEESGALRFRARAVERDVVVLDRGLARIAS